ncbi:putative bifunctional diguanylate cyclase/phosphodiesterase [Sphingomonas sp. ID0503]|uniref:putative bifunctional diguanylate cyclase/phosphodiesterase n=1 Tax=Sphingomonas sp. ID0503 TaxID=3399691 RepID=UPI003AFB69E0
MGLSIIERASNWQRRLGASLASADGDKPAAIVALAALVLLAVNLGQMVRGLAGSGLVLDQLFGVAIILNVALLLLARIHLRDMRADLYDTRREVVRATALAHQDSVTGLLNRRGLFAAGQSMLANATRDGGAIAMIAIDLDGFKAVNDTQGHAAGDRLLQLVGKALREELPSRGVAARIGGDEFTCIVPCEKGEAAALAERIVHRLGHGFAEAGPDAAISASVGYVCRIAEPAASIDLLLRQADRALYAAKRAGGDRATAHDATMELAAAMEAAFETDMRAGLTRGEFVPFFEQQIDFENGTLLGFEVLARWCHPDRGVLSPDAFLPAAEKSGLIGPISLAVMRTAFEEARYWNSLLTLTVNISPRQFRDPWFAQKLLHLLHEAGFPPERLEVDIPEDAITGNLQLARSLAEGLRKEGVRLAFDRFGTGASSLSSIRALPFHRIKLDRSIVGRMHEDSECAAIVEAVAALAPSLGLQVVVGGISDAAIQQRVSRHGFRKGQGFHLGKPMTEEHAREFLANRSLLTAGPAAPLGGLRLAG